MSVLLARTRELMRETLIPMTKVAKHVDCAVQTLHAIKRGANVPSVELCEKIYNFLSRDPLKVK